MTICLNDRVPGSDNFKWQEILYLPRWQVYAMPDTYTIYKNLKLITHRLEMVREVIGSPLIVTSGWRPRLYNTLIGGAKNSAHIHGRAIDFYALDYPGGDGCDKVRSWLENKLDQFDIRMERNPGGNWVHIDINSVGQTGRYFYP